MSAMVVVACKNEVKETAEAEPEVTQEEAPKEFELYGEDFDTTLVYAPDVLLAKYDKMQVGDTLDITINAKVNSVCQKKGCWMRLELEPEKEAFVKFKDYGFFMPMDLAGQEVIVHGKAYKEETSVEDLKHLAEDAGKPQSEIDAITEPELVYSFLSSGVKIPNKS